MVKKIQLTRSRRIGHYILAASMQIAWWTHTFTSLFYGQARNSLDCLYWRLSKGENTYCHPKF